MKKHKPSSELSRLSAKRIISEKRESLLLGNQKGFTVVEILLALLVVAVIGFGGYYVWHTQNNKANKNSASVSPDAPSPTSPTTNQTTGSDKLVFKEFGVQMTLPADLKGVIYKAETITSISGQKVIAIYLSDSDTNYTNDIAKCYDQAPVPLQFGAIGKTSGQYPSDANAQTVDGPLLKQFRDFYIDWSVPNGITTCSNSSVDPGLVQSDAHKLQKSFFDAFQATATLAQ